MAQRGDLAAAEHVLESEGSFPTRQACCIDSVRVITRYNKPYGILLRTSPW